MSINVQKHDIKTINASDCATSHSTDIVTSDNGFFCSQRVLGIKAWVSDLQDPLLSGLPPKNKKNKTLKWCGPACKTAEGQRHVLRRCAVVEDHIWYSRYEYTYTHTHSTDTGVVLSLCTKILSGNTPNVFLIQRRLKSFLLLLLFFVSLLFPPLSLATVF